jgi:hypothetical protein
MPAGRTDQDARHQPVTIASPRQRLARILPVSCRVGVHSSNCASAFGFMYVKRGHFLWFLILAIAHQQEPCECAGDWLRKMRTDDLSTS